MWYGESFCWWETLNANVPCSSDIWARSIQWLDKSWRSTWPVWPTNTKCEYSFFFKAPHPPICHPLALASIFTRQIYSLPWCAPGQSQSWESNLFESKLLNDDDYLVFNCKKRLEISMFVYFCRLGCIKHCERKGKVFACLDSIGRHGQCRKFARICTLTSDGDLQSRQKQTRQQDNVKMKTKGTKSKPSFLSSYSRLEFTCWVPTSNHKRKA